MKLTTFLFFINLLHISAIGFSQDQKVSVRLDKATLKEMFSSIEKQTNYKFLYRDDILENLQVSLSENNVKVGDLLAKAFQNSRNTFTIIDNNLIVIAVKESRQQQKVTGTVSDALNGEPIIGANVLIDGTTIGVVTDANGKFSLDIPKPGAVIVVSYLGYNTEKVTLNGQNVIDVKLVQDITKLDEIVVVGYGTVKKSDLTGAVSSISSDAIKRSNSVNIDQVLQGRVAGVQASSMGGKPGAPLSVNIRGINSPNGNDPLYVIDGVPVGNGSNADQNIKGTNQLNQNTGMWSNFDLTSLNPSDIESIDILKDASATAIYGSRAANGVVVITTKRGKKGSAKINFDAYYGSQTLVKKIDMLGSVDFMKFVQEARTNASEPVFSKYDDMIKGDVKYYDTNWQDQVYHSAAMQNYNISVSGGNDKLSYYVNGGYMNQEGIMGNSGFKKYSIRMNLDAEVTNWLKVGVNVSGSNTHSALTDQQNNYSAPYDALANLPMLPVYWNQGDQAIFGGTSDILNEGSYSGPTNALGFSSYRRNPVLLANEYPPIVKKYMALGNLFADVKLFKGLTYHISAGGTFNYARGEQFNPVINFGTAATFTTPTNSLNVSHNSGLQGQFDQYLTYHLESGIHNLTLMAGQSISSVQTSILQAQRGKFSTYTTSLSAGDPSTVGNNGSSTENNLQSFFGRLNYNLMDRYLLTATIRRDGSSVFGPENKYANFPSFAFGWRLSKEEFMKSIQWISNLKLRGSWGQTGAQNISPYSYLQLIGTGWGKPVFGSGVTLQNSAITSNIPNPDLKWESTTQIDGGFDLSILKNKFNLTFDWYSKSTKNLLLSSLPIPSYIGYGGPAVNMGEFQNQGIEIGLDIKDILNSRDFFWDFNINYSLNRNKVVNIGYNTDYLSTNNGRTYPGDPYGQFWGHKVDKIFQTPQEIVDLNANAVTRQTQLGLTGTVYQPNGPAPGDIKFMDINGTDGTGKLVNGQPDGIVNDKDRTYIGNPNPKFIFGFNNRFEYKNFDLNIFCQGVYGNQIYDRSREGFETLSASGDFFNQTTSILNRWMSATEPGDGKTPRAIDNDPNGNNRFSDRWIEDGSYLRVKNITLGYSLQNVIVKKLGMNRLHIYVSLNDYFTFTKYKWYNPDISNLSNNLNSRGVDYNIYPLAKSIIFGINVGL